MNVLELANLNKSLFLKAKLNFQEEISQKLLTWQLAMSPVIEQWYIVIGN